jgi:hypothetical protein
MNTNQASSSRVETKIPNLQQVSSLLNYFLKKCIRSIVKCQYEHGRLIRRCATEPKGKEKLERHDNINHVQSKDLEAQGTVGKGWTVGGMHLSYR